METNEKRDEVKHPTMGEYRVGSSYPEELEHGKELREQAAMFIDCSIKKDMAGARKAETTFTAKCIMLSNKTQNQEAKRCFQFAIEFSRNAVSSIVDTSKSQRDMEMASMWVTKAVYKPEVPEHLR